MMSAIGKPYRCAFATLFLLAASGCTLPDVDVKPESKKQASERSSDADWRFPERDSGASPARADAGESSSDGGTEAAEDAGKQPGASAAGSRATAGASAAVGGSSGSTRPSAAAASGGSGGASANAAGAGGAASSECQHDEDCVQRGPEHAGGRCENAQCVPNPRWRCEPPPTASGSETRELTLPVIDSLQLSKLANVRIVACNKPDYTCMQPVSIATSDEDGNALLTVPATFSGYMQQTERNDYTPALYFAEPPYNGVFRNFPLIPSSAFSGLAVALGTQVDRARGHAMLIVEDCKGEALGGITFTSPQADDKSKQFYVRDQIPTTSAEDTPPEGDGGYVNLPAGVIEITALNKKTGLVLNTVNALIRAESVTTVYIRPAVRGSSTK